MYTLIVFAFFTAGTPTVWLITGQFPQAECEQKRSQYEAQARAIYPGIPVAGSCYRMAG